MSDLRLQALSECSRRCISRRFDHDVVSAAILPYAIAPTAQFFPRTGFADGGLAVVTEGITFSSRFMSLCQRNTRRRVGVWAHRRGPTAGCRMKHMHKYETAHSYGGMLKGCIVPVRAALPRHRTGRKGLQQPDSCGARTTGEFLSTTGR